MTAGRILSLERLDTRYGIERNGRIPWVVVGLPACDRQPRIMHGFGPPTTSVRSDRMRSPRSQDDRSNETCAVAARDGGDIYDRILGWLTRGAEVDGAH